MTARAGTAEGAAEDAGPRRPARWPGALSARLEAVADAERDQLPLWLPVGLGLGTAAWFWLPDGRAWTAFLLLALAAALLPLALAPGTRWGRACAVFCLAAAVGSANIWWKAERAAAPVLAQERLAAFTARVETLQRLPARGAVRLVVAPIGAPDLPTRIRINVDEAVPLPGLAAGATVRLRAWLMPPAPPAVPGAYDFARSAWFQGIGATGRAYEAAVVAPARPSGFRARLADWRQRLADHIRGRLPPTEGGIAAALATGDQAGIPEADAEAMRRAGLAHLLSVSGLHLTAVVGAVMLAALKLLALSPFLALRFRLVVVAAGAGALAGIAYTLLTGAEVPTVRACIASVLVLLGIALGRDALTLRLVAVAALIVLLLWPETLPGPSFQMSFAAIVAIVVLHDHPRMRAFVERRDEAGPLRLGRFLAGLVLTGIAVEAALVPIALFHFHQAGLYGAFANIVAIPLTTFLIMPIEALALLLDPVGLGAPFWWLAGRALAFLVWLAHATAAAPGAVALLPAIPRGAFALVVAGGLWLCLWRGRWRRWGLVPAAAGALWALAVPAPDLLVTGDGRHLALRASDGRHFLLRPRAGDYVRDILGELSSAPAPLFPLEELATVSCSADLCLAEAGQGGARWRILATRSTRLVDSAALARACAAADIVVADRRLPPGCRPRWLRADSAFLSRAGGLALSLGHRPVVATVAAERGAHPWAVASAPARR